MSKQSSVSPGAIQSVERALNILKLFKEYDELGITQLSQLMELPKGTVHGLVKTLEQNGFLEKTSETQRYRCGVEVFKLGMSIAVRMDVRRIASDRAQELCRLVQETVHLAVLMDGMCVNIDRFSPSKPFLLIPQVGSAVPAHCTATGKVLLSQLTDEQLQALVERNELSAYTEHTVTDLEALRRQLQQVRERGYAVSNQEALLGLTCIAAPIRDFTGSIAAAISVAGGTESVMEKERNRMIINAVTGTAAAISSDLGYEEK